MGVIIGPRGVNHKRLQERGVFMMMNANRTNGG